MSDTADVVATVVTPAPTTVQQPTPPAPKTDADPGDGSLPQWVAKRLEQKERALLKDLGAADLAEVKAALAERAELKEKSKSAEQKAQERMAELEAAAKERDDLRKDLADYAEQALLKLSDKERDLILDAAPRSPAKQLRLIEKLTGIAPAGAPAKPIPAAASTTAAVPAPAPTTPMGENVLATYDDLLQRSPVRAAEYRLANWDAYIKAKQARA